MKRISLLISSLFLALMSAESYSWCETSDLDACGIMHYGCTVPKSNISKLGQCYMSGVDSVSLGTGENDTSVHSTEVAKNLINDPEKAWPWYAGFEDHINAYTHSEFETIVLSIRLDQMPMEIDKRYPVISTGGEWGKSVHIDDAIPFPLTWIPNTDQISVNYKIGEVSYSQKVSMDNVGTGLGYFIDSIPTIRKGGVPVLGVVTDVCIEIESITGMYSNGTGSTKSSVTECFDFEYPILPSISSITASNVEIGNVDTNGSFSVNWSQSGEEDARYEFMVSRKLGSGTWAELGKYPISTTSLDQSGLADGQYTYKVETCWDSVCRNPREKVITVNKVPSAITAATNSTYIHSTDDVITWAHTPHHDKYGNLYYKLKVSKSEHSKNRFSEIDLTETEEVTVNTSQSLSFIENGFDYKISVAACNVGCSAYVNLKNGEAGEIFQSVFPPSGNADAFRVEPLNFMDTDDDLAEPLIGNSTNGRYALNLTSINASQFEIHELWVLRNTVVEEITETAFVPVSVDPALIIPINKYLQNIVETEDHSNSPFLSNTEDLGNRYIVDKPIEITSRYQNFSKPVSGTYYYTVTACDRLWNLHNPTANEGLTKSDHCVTSPQIIVEVDLEIKQPSPGSIIFDQNGVLTADFDDSNLAAPTSFRLYDEQDRLIGIYYTLLDAQSAMRTYQGNLFGIQIVACNASACTDAQQVIVPPLSPAFLKITGSDTGGDFNVEWAASNGAEEYELSFEVFDLDDPAKRVFPLSGKAVTINTNTTKWTYSAGDDMKFGRYQFSVKSKNSAGTSESKGPAIWMVELDPTLYIRKQLYTAWEQDDCQATSEADCLELGDKVIKDSPEDGEYNRDKAAFRYIDAIYKKEGSTSNIQNLASSNEFGDQLIIDDPLSSDDDVTVIYGVDERDKALRAENFARALLAEQPTNSNIRQLILDIYYDRAVVEMLIADSLRTKARVMRFIDESVNTESYDLLVEAELHNRASKAYELALFGEFDANNQFKLPGYSNLISSFNSVYQDILVEFSAERAQVSPRYWDDNKIAVSRLVLPEGNDENGLLLNGYKDLVLIYELMAELLNSKSEALKLTVMAGESNVTAIEELDFELRELRAKIHNLHVSLIGNRSECLNYVRYYRFNEEGLPSYTDEQMNSMCRTDNYPNDFPFTKGLFGERLDEIESNQWNGFLSAKSNYLKADESIDTVRKWLDGDVNIIGLPDNILFRKELDEKETSFDEYILELEKPNSSYSKLNASFIQAKSDYESFRSNSDRSATEYTSRVSQWQAKLVSLLGYDCSVTSCDKTGGYEGSEMSLQVKAIEAAYLEQKLAEEQVEIFDQQLLIEIGRLQSLRQNNGKSIEITLDYGSQQIDIEKRITKLRIDAMKKQRRLGAMTSITNASSAFASGFVGSGGNPYAGAASAGASMANSFADYQAAGIAINSTRSIGKLEQLSAELALEQQVKLMLLSHENEELALAASIEAKWLEANTYLINVERAAKNVELEYEKLSYIVEQAEYAFKQIELASQETSDRYFADPIHARRVTNSMIKAEEDFQYVQQRLWLAANMLEYKLGVFLSAGEVEHGFEKRDVLKARTVRDLQNYLTKMKAYDENYDVNGDTEIAEISLKDHLMGYEDVYDEFGNFVKIHKNPNPEKASEIPLLSGVDAFEEHVAYGWSLFNDASKLEEYQSWKSDSPYYFAVTEGNGVNLVINVDTNKYIKPVASVENDLFGRLSIGKNSNTGELCYRDLGNYANVIKKIGVNVDVSLVNTSKVKGSIGYSGKSRSYKRYVPDLDGSDGNLVIYSGDEPQYIGDGDDQMQVLFSNDLQYHLLQSKINEVNAAPYEFDLSALTYSEMQSYNQYKNGYLGFADFVEYPARNWYYNDLGELEFDSSIDVSFDMAVRISRPVIDDITKWSPSIYSNSKLKELSIFTDEWKIEIPIKGSDNSNGNFYVSPIRLDDIQFYIQYDKTDRNGDSQKCP